MSIEDETQSELAEFERRRLRALVAADMAVAGDAHASDFELVTPGGATLTKDDYLGRIAAGALKYVVWEAFDIQARVRGDAGCVRYHSLIDVVFDGERSGPTRCWHTDYYERRAGRWQVVWSHATRRAADA